MDDAGEHAWLLIAVLVSTFPIAQPLAIRLYRGAVELERTQGGKESIAGDFGSGELRRLGRDLLLGVVGGPGFEAELDTPQGRGVVRFILTRQGLEHAGLAESNSMPMGRDRRTMN